MCCGPGANSGLHEFRRLANGWAEGTTRLTYAGEGPGQAEARVLLRLTAKGKFWVKELSLTESTPVPPRWVRVACTSGRTTLASCEAVLDTAGKAGADLVLLPEYMQGDRIEEPLKGPSYQLMSAKAKQYGMYVAGGIVRQDKTHDLVYNTALLFDRKGKYLGLYDKLHPYSPELTEQGISVGRHVPVFRTDFGTIGIIICYDSWFTDVVELLALKGARMILFPNAGYYRALMHARSADNRVRIVCSSWNSGSGVWDTVGRDIVNPSLDESHGNPPGVTYQDVVESKVGDVGLLMASLDMNCSPSPHYNGGSMWEAPGGTRNRRDQALFLEELIKAERERWWTE
jgi:predicted amidohydrolase